VVLWDVARKKARLTITTRNSQVSSIDFSPDEQVIAGACDDHTVTLWDTKTGRQKAIWQAHTQAVCFSPDGKRVASGSWDRKIIVWEMPSGQQLTTLAGHSKGILSLAFSPNGKILASGSLDGTVRLWDTASGKERTVLKAQNRVSSVAFSPDGRMLASSGASTTVMVWDVDSGAMKSRFSTGTINTDRVLWFTPVVPTVAFSPNGRTLASSCFANKGSTLELLGVVKLWDVSFLTPR
jgi:WD40 repeat protein